MRCQSLSFLLAIWLSGLTDALPNPSPTTKNLRRQVNPDSYCSSFPCTPPAVPVFNQVFNTCGCKTIPPQCANLTCDALHHQSYNNATGKCTCEFGTGIMPVPTEIPPYLIGKVSKRDSPLPPVCPDVVCGAGNTLDPDTCACNAIAPPDSCPLIKCRGGYHPVYHATTGSCGCDLDCPGLICTEQFSPFYNFSTKACTCEDFTSFSDETPTTTSTIIKQLPPITSSIIKQLPPITSSVVKQAPPFTLPFTSLPTLTGIRVGPPISATFPTHRPATFQTLSASLALPPFYQTAPVAAPPAATAPVALPPATGTGCTDVYCISEMHPVFNNELQRCQCVWIEGLGPAGT